MHRFFIPAANIEGHNVVLSKEVSQQLDRVLRCKRGDTIIVLDNSGWEYEVILTSIHFQKTKGSITSSRIASCEPQTHISMYQSILKNKGFEFALQKTTELGISRFVPTISARSAANTADGDKQKARRTKIITESAEQSCRGKIPILEPTVSLITACEQLRGPAVMPWENEHATSLRSVIRRWKTDGNCDAGINLFIGPEGGFTANEVEYARSMGIETVTLGPRILRAETASVAAVSAMLYELGDLGG